MKLNEKTKEEILPRIRKVKGQIEGIEKMVQERRYCVDIINQITAVRRALEKISLMIMESHIRTHVKEAIKHDEKSDEMIKELTETIFKFIR
ncbi:MAG: metal-sensitive transcriptional regulator [candidate division WOR-3 bacterium]